MSYRKYPFFKFLCILLSVLLIYQADHLLAFQDTNQAAFDQAKEAYFKGDYEAARNILDKLIVDLEGLEGMEVLRGETFLLAGATYEKLKYKKISIQYYCRAKQILGQDRTFDPLVLKELKWYKKKCPTGVVIVPGKRKKKKGGGFGTILGVVLLAGVVWYLFLSKNAPLKKKKYGAYTSVTAKLDITFKGINSKGTRILTIGGVEKLNEWYTFPQDCDSNSTCDDATKTRSHSYTFTTTGSSFKLILEYMGWNYYTWKAGYNCKWLCVNTTMSIVDYAWEEGKDDPGSPSIGGLEQLSQFNVDDVCVERTTRIDDCTQELTVSYSRGSSKARTLKRSYSVSSSKKKCSVQK